MKGEGLGEKCPTLFDAPSLEAGQITHDVSHQVVVKIILCMKAKESNVFLTVNFFYVALNSRVGQHPPMLKKVLRFFKGQSVGSSNHINLNPDDEEDSQNDNDNDPTNLSNSD